MATPTEHPHIEKDEEILSGEAIIIGTRTPVRAIVELWRLGYAPDEIPHSLPHLTLAAIYDALSYYFDHQDEVNASIKRNHIPEELVDPRARAR